MDEMKNSDWGLWFQTIQQNVPWMGSGQQRGPAHEWYGVAERRKAGIPSLEFKNTYI